MLRNELFNKAISEEQNRRSASFREFKKLFELYAQKIATVSDIGKLQLTIKQKLADLKTLITNITVAWKELPKASFPFKTNKNSEILECANDYLTKYGFVTLWDSMLENHPMVENEKTWLGVHNNDYKGTSIINCVQALTYITLVELDEIENIKKLNIYNITSSPLIQTTALPPTATEHPLYYNFSQSFFFFKDHNSAAQGELMFFTLGYSFGGSRPDIRHHNKEFRTEDCSSAVAKWLETNCSFTTHTLKSLFQDDCKDKDPCCESTRTTLKPLGTTLGEVAPGDIYVFQKGGHMGIVTEILNETHFETLSYTRVMPEIEGLGYTEDSLLKRDYYFFGYKSEVSENYPDL